MLFCGNYIQKVDDDIIELKFDLQNQVCDVLCLEWKNKDISIAIFPPDSSDIEEFCGYYRVLEWKKIRTGNEFKLSQYFLNFLDGENEVVVLGVGDKIEIMKKDSLKKVATLSDEEVNKLLHEIKEKFDELDL